MGLFATKCKQLSLFQTHTICRAAVGWLELGNHLEANEELERIAPTLRVHPDVLAVRWSIYAKAGKWDASLDIAKAITQIDPTRLEGWIDLSIALYRLGRTQDAWDSLSAKLATFPDAWIVHYNLACYAAQLGKISVAEKLLTRAIELGNANQVKLIALDDPDLEPIWKNSPFATTLETIQIEKPRRTSGLVIKLFAGLHLSCA